MRSTPAPNIHVAYHRTSKQFFALNSVRLLPFLHLSYSLCTHIPLCYFSNTNLIRKKTRYVKCEFKLFENIERSCHIYSSSKIAEVRLYCIFQSSENFYKIQAGLASAT